MHCLQNALRSQFSQCRNLQRHRDPKSSLSWITVDTIAVGTTAIGGVAVGLINAIGLAAISFLNAMGLVTFSPVNAVGLVAIGGRERSGRSRCRRHQRSWVGCHWRDELHGNNRRRGQKRQERAALLLTPDVGAGFRVGRRAVREPPLREDRWGWPRRSARTWSGSLRRAAVSG